MLTKDREMRREFLKELFESIVTRDIAARYSLRKIRWGEVDFVKSHMEVAPADRIAVSMPERTFHQRLISLNLFFD